MMETTKTMIGVLVVLLLLPMHPLTAQNSKVVAPPATTATTNRLDKTTDLEIRLLIQKITTKELQLQQLSQSLTSERQTLNSMVESACKSKGIEMPKCNVRMENGKGGEEYLTFSKVPGDDDGKTTKVTTTKSAKGKEKGEN